jgi:hypothetical protein
MADLNRFGLGTLLAVTGISLGLGFGVGRLKTYVPSAVDGAKSRVRKSVDLGGDETPMPRNSSADSGSMATTGAFSEEKLQQASALLNPRLREHGMEEALAHANLDEVKRALRWAESLPDGPIKKAALADILQRWAEMDGAGATNYATQLYEATGNAGPLREALQGWAQSDPNGALERLQSLGLTDGLKADIRSDLVAQWTEQNPQGAAAYAASNRDTGSWMGLVSTVADQWSKEDPKMAASWAGSLPAGLDQIHAVNSVISNWYQANPNEAAAYVSSQAPGASRDTMALTLARQIGQEDPAAGLKWAGTVGDPKTQEKAAAGALSDVYRKNPEGALQTLANSSLPKAMRDSVTARLQSPGPWWR